MTRTPPAAAPIPGDTRKGFFLALGAYLIWGSIPFYFRALGHVPVDEVIVHRILWSVPVALLVLVWLGRTSDLWLALRNPRMLLMAAVTAALVSINWGIYIWAVQQGRLLDAALGYYINPLFSILLGSLLLGERLSGRKWLAVALAALAVVVLTLEAGGLPLIALSLTVTWGFYAYFKRSLPIGPNQGFTLEVILLTPPALAWLAWKAWSGTLHGFSGPAGEVLLLIGAGVVTAVPLMLYANGAKGLTLTTIAVMQYLTPTILFISAVFAFGEPFGGARMIAFPLIWLALIIYSSTYFQSGRKPG